MKSGCGRRTFIHTYMGDGNPLPSFEEDKPWLVFPEHRRVYRSRMENLNADNKVSLFVRYIDIATGNYETRIINKNK